MPSDSAVAETPEEKSKRRSPEPAELKQTSRKSGEDRTKEKGRCSIDVPKPKPKNTKKANTLTAEGVKLYNRGKYKESIKKFESALAVSPGSKQALVAYTRALLEVNRLRDAASRRKSPRADPKNAEIFTARQCTARPRYGAFN